VKNVSVPDDTATPIYHHFEPRIAATNASTVANSAATRGSPLLRFAVTMSRSAVAFDKLANGLPLLSHPKRIPAAPNPYCTTKVSFVLCVSVVEPEVKLPVTVRA
jgi:hypothetical protein